MSHDPKCFNATEITSQPEKASAVPGGKRVRILETLARMQKQLDEINKALYRSGTLKRDQSGV